MASNFNPRLSSYAAPRAIPPNFSRNPTYFLETSSTRSSQNYYNNAPPPSYTVSQQQAAASAAAMAAQTTTQRAPAAYEQQPIKRTSTSSSDYSYSADHGKASDIKTWSTSLERMQDARLDAQRYVMTRNKSDEVSKLALGAKVERALSRRMVGQDASFTKKNPAEKRSLEVKAN